MSSVTRSKRSESVTAMQEDPEAILRGRRKGQRAIRGTARRNDRRKNTGGHNFPEVQDVATTPAGQEHSRTGDDETQPNPATLQVEKDAGQAASIVEDEQKVHETTPGQREATQADKRDHIDAERRGGPRKSPIDGPGPSPGTFVRTENNANQAEQVESTTVSTFDAPEASAAQRVQRNPPSQTADDANQTEQAEGTVATGTASASKTTNTPSAPPAPDAPATTNDPAIPGLDSTCPSATIATAAEETTARHRDSLRSYEHYERQDAERERREREREQQLARSRQEFEEETQEGRRRERIEWEDDDREHSQDVSGQGIDFCGLFGDGDEEFPDEEDGEEVESLS